MINKLVHKANFIYYFTKYHNWQKLEQNYKYSVFACMKALFNKKVSCKS